jgi:hypothetical protein
MIRIVTQELLIFLVPFGLYALVLLIGRRNPFRLAAWSERVFHLALAGLVCVIVGFVITGIVAERKTGQVYEPAHLENGRLVPGRFR